MGRGVDESVESSWGVWIAYGYYIITIYNEKNIWNLKDATLSKHCILSDFTTLGNSWSVTALERNQNNVLRVRWINFN